MQRVKEQDERTVNKVLVFDILDFETQIASIFSGFSDKWVEQLGSMSNQEQLSQLGSLFKVIHFSVHGVIDQRNPYRSSLSLRPFEQDSILYLRELYELSIPADLVVTSACSAGLGKLHHRGRGMLSIAQGFAYAGTRSLITTLWPIEDGSTGKILRDFYERLANEGKKGMSLSMAKRNYLNNSGVDDGFSHPYYWAGLITIGDTSTIHIDSASLSHRVYWIFGVIIIFFILQRIAANRKQAR